MYVRSETITNSQNLSENITVKYYTVKVEKLWSKLKPVLSVNHKIWYFY